MNQKQSKTETTVILDKRSYSKKNNGYPIKFRLYHQSDRKYIKTNYFCQENHWIYGKSQDEEVQNAVEKGEIVYVSKKHPNSTRLNRSLNAKNDSLQQFQSKNESNLNNYTPGDLLKALQLVADRLDPYVDLNDLLKKNSTLKEVFTKAILEKHNTEDWGTKKTYEQSLETFIKYFEYIGIQDVRLIDISKKWVDDFDTWFSQQDGRGGGKVKASTRSKKLSQLFKLMQDICDDEDEVMGWNDYRFMRYKLPKNKTAKRSIDFKKLDFEELSKKFDLSKVANLMDLIRQLKLVKDSPRWHYRNMLLFIWDCRGMDLIDMAFLNGKSVYNKTIEYSRTKLREEEMAIIDLNEEALEILELYNYKDKRPNELIFPWMKDVYDENLGKTEEVYNKYKDRVRYFNNAITKMLESIGLDNATSKMIRHTWAQDGYRKFENRDIISEGLLHHSVQTSKTYARDLDRERLNNVNEAITERKSTITTIEDNLQVDLFQYFHKGKTWGVETEEFKNRILRKINTFNDRVKILLTPKQFSEWTKLLNDFSNSAFDSYDAVEEWINTFLKARFEKQADLRIITSDYNL